MTGGCHGVWQLLSAQRILEAAQEKARCSSLPTANLENTQEACGGNEPPCQTMERIAGPCSDAAVRESRSAEQQGVQGPPPRADPIVSTCIDGGENHNANVILDVEKSTLEHEGKKPCGQIPSNARPARRLPKASITLAGGISAAIRSPPCLSESPPARSLPPLVLPLSKLGTSPEEACGRPSAAATGDGLSVSFHLVPHPLVASNLGSSPRKFNPVKEQSTLQGCTLCLHLMR